MGEADKKTTPPARRGDGLGYAAYRAARERFLARLRADSEERRRELRRTRVTTPDAEQPDP